MIRDDRKNPIRASAMRFPDERRSQHELVVVDPDQIAGAVLQSDRFGEAPGPIHRPRV
jgi:hypothetical protein